MPKLISETKHYSGALAGKKSALVSLIDSNSDSAEGFQSVPEFSKVRRSFSKSSQKKCVTVSVEDAFLPIDENLNAKISGQTTTCDQAEGKLFDCSDYHNKAKKIDSSLIKRVKNHYQTNNTVITNNAAQIETEIKKVATVSIQDVEKQYQQQITHLENIKFLQQELRQDGVFLYIADEKEQWECRRYIDGKLYSHNITDFMDHKTHNASKCNIGMEENSGERMFQYCNEQNLN